MSALTDTGHSEALKLSKLDGRYRPIAVIQETAPEHREWAQYKSRVDRIAYIGFSQTGDKSSLETASVSL